MSACWPAGREAARNLAPAAEITESFERLLDWKPDGLVVATPDRFHIEQVNEACQRQIAVLVEKPLAENLEQGMTCREPVKYNRGRVLVGYPLRFCQVAREHQHFLDIVAGRAEPLITIEQGLGAIAVADALIAAAENRRWQAVNYDFQRCLT